MVTLVYVGESLSIGLCPVHLVDRYSLMLGRGGVERNMPCVATRKRNMSKVSPD